MQVRSDNAIFLSASFVISTAYPWIDFTKPPLNPAEGGNCILLIRGYRVEQFGLLNRLVFVS